MVLKLAVAEEATVAEPQLPVDIHKHVPLHEFDDPTAQC
jgi:hypothetical protein